MIETLRIGLADWTDMDVAAFRLSLCLGLIDDEPGLFQTRAKHVFWSTNPVGASLCHFLEQLAAIGVLERREEPEYQYRWNAGFVGSWMRPESGLTS